MIVTEGSPKGQAERNERLEAALAYHETLGWSVTPLCPPDHAGCGDAHKKTCKKPGKVPLLREWNKKKLSADDLRDWWRLHPNCNVGVVMGEPSGIVSIDLDGEEAVALWVELSRELKLQATWEFKTGGGGQRIVYRIPEGRRVPSVTIKTGDGELKLLAESEPGEALQTVAPPSIHENGKPYVWSLMLRPGSIEVAVMPEALIRWFEARRASNGPVPNETSANGFHQRWREQSADPMTVGRNYVAAMGFIPDSRADNAMDASEKMLKLASGLLHLEAARLTDEEIVELLTEWGAEDPGGMCDREMAKRKLNEAKKTGYVPRSRFRGGKMDYQGGGGAEAGEKIFDLKPLSEWRRWGPGGRDWCWEGYLTFGRVTAFHASAKAGKSTFLTLFFKALEDGSMFCDRRTAQTRVLLLSEEHEEDVTERTDVVELSDNVIGQAVPFMSKPDRKTWERAIDELVEFVKANSGKWLVVLVTASAMWAIKQENDNGEMGECLMPLRKLSEAGAAVMVVHHGKEKLRGATAFEGFADTIITMTEPGDDEPDQRVRCIKAKGRASKTPRRMTVRLSEDGKSYEVLAKQPGQARPKKNVRETAVSLIQANPGKTVAELVALWPDPQDSPEVGTLYNALKKELESETPRIRKEGGCKRNAAGTFWPTVHSAGAPKAPVSE